MIHVYGVLAKPADLPDVEGLDGSPVEYLEAAGLTLAVSRHRVRPEASDETVLRHAHVVEHLVQGGVTVLPARFGLHFDDEPALERSVGERADDLRVSLQRVEGCAEFGVRVLAPEQEKAPAASGGGDYMRARLQELTDRERLAHDLHEQLAGLARDASRADASGGLLLSAAYLVADPDVDAFLGEVRRLESSYPDLALVCTGPWPPYTFTAAAREDGS